MAGLNDDGPIPNQRLVYIDPYSLEIEGGSPPPPAPPQYAWRGNTGAQGHPGARGGAPERLRVDLQRAIEARKHKGVWR
jgi:hypothetical protein